MCLADGELSSRLDEQAMRVLMRRQGFLAVGRQEEERVCISGLVLRLQQPQASVVVVILDQFVISSLSEAALVK
jgi:hypothetical protein